MLGQTGCQRQSTGGPAESSGGARCARAPRGRYTGTTHPRGSAREDAPMPKDGYAGSGPGPDDRHASRRGLRSPVSAQHRGPIGYVESHNREQWRFTWHRVTREAFLRGGDANWERGHAVHDGRVDGWLLAPEDTARLQACWCPARVATRRPRTRTRRASPHSHVGGTHITTRVTHVTTRARAASPCEPATEADGSRGRCQHVSHPATASRAFDEARALKAEQGPPRCLGRDSKAPDQISPPDL
jgi:hypothetical protein